MYRLMVVAGPTRGATYFLEGEDVLIGRQDGNGIILQSPKVSKRHCRLVVSNGEVTVQDEGSANGTFVNGALVRSRKLKAGDRIGVGEFVLELVPPPTPPRPPSARRETGNTGGIQLDLGAGGGNVIPFPGSGVSTPAGATGAFGLPGMPSSAAPLGATGGIATSRPAMPTDLKDKLAWIFDHRVMPMFYGLLFKYEWRVLTAGLVGFWVLLNLMVSVQPLVDNGARIAVEEAMLRAKFMARQIVDRNQAVIAQRMETKAELGFGDREPGLKSAYLIDVQSRIIAPSDRFNQFLTTGEAAKLAVEARKKYQGGGFEGPLSRIVETEVIAIEPLKVFDQRQQRNQVVAMAVVSLDTTVSTPGFGDLGVTYSETMIRMGILALALVFILQRLTLKPLQVLNEDVDKVLKGEMSQVTREFKFEEIDPLIDVINSALQRAGKGGGDADGAAAPDSNGQARVAEALTELAQFLPSGALVMGGDRVVSFINSAFEEITGIRHDASVGQTIESVARDQGFVALMQDMISRADSGGRTISEETEFSGVAFKLHLHPFGSAGDGTRVFLLTAVKSGG